MSAVGRLGAVISFVGIVVVSYKIGKYHAVKGYSSPPPPSSHHNKSSNHSRSSNFPNNKKDTKTNVKKAQRKDTKLNSKQSSEEDQSSIEATKKIIRPKPQENLESITLKPIGKISSVYRLCVGTPRQGLLAPNSRGRIDLYPNQISSESVSDLDQYSHLWIVFIFHLNSLKRGQ